MLPHLFLYHTSTETQTMNRIFWRYLYNTRIQSGDCRLCTVIATTDFLHKKNFSLINYVGQRQRFTVTKRELRMLPNAWDYKSSSWQLAIDPECTSARYNGYDVYGAAVLRPDEYRPARLTRLCHTPTSSTESEYFRVENASLRASLLTRHGRLYTVSQKTSHLWLVIILTHTIRLR